MLISGLFDTVLSGEQNSIIFVVMFDRYVTLDDFFSLLLVVFNETIILSIMALAVTFECLERWRGNDG